MLIGWIWISQHQRQQLWHIWVDTPMINDDIFLCDPVITHIWFSLLILGWTMCFLPMNIGLVQMLNGCVIICNHFLFFYSLYNLSLIFTDYSSITFWCVLNETISVEVNVSLYKYCLYGFVVHFGCFLALQSWISNHCHDALGIQIEFNFSS